MQVSRRLQMDYSDVALAWGYWPLWQGSRPSANDVVDCEKADAFE